LKDPTDEELMTRVASGDLESLKFLFERHHMHVYNFICKMSGNKPLSEDITQDVFYKVLKYRESYNNGKFISWLFTIARNSLASYYKSPIIQQVGMDAYENVLRADEDTITEERSQLQQALDKLNPSDRELLILNRLQEIKYPELAEIMGSTTGAIKTRVNRALQKLRTIYFVKT
jgi:RNA polymerase sigma-70 factor (ECF subfamily)